MGLTVLIVDDHAGFRVRVRTLLQIEGYEVAGEAGDGASALAAVGALRPCVVLLDIGLPDMDGFEVARMLVEGLDPPAVVLTSTRDASDYGRRIASSGALGFIWKAEMSGARLRELLGGQG